MQTLAQSLQERFELVAGDLLPSVLKLTSRANRVYVGSATQTLKVAIECTDGLPGFLPSLVAELGNPSKTVRVAASECIQLSLTVSNPGGKIEQFSEEVEKAILTGIGDPATEVRMFAKGTFNVYKTTFPLRVDR